MKLATLGIIFAAVFAIGLLFAWAIANGGSPVRTASEWQAESWMQKDTTLPEKLPTRVLAITDLPPLEHIQNSS